MNTHMQTPPPTTFGRKLAEIRAAARRRRSEGRARRRTASVDRARALLASLDAVERMRAIVARRVEELAGELALDVRSEQRFYDSRWSVSACLDELVVGPRGRPRTQATRAVFLIAPRPDDARIALECHVTVRGHDLVTTRDAEALTDAGLSRLVEAVEHGLIALAEAWTAPAAAIRRRPLGTAA
ncbi:MAG: hypothetical protein ACYTG2_11005 [Planctomycetota bacterium]|jgi:hypothetical protein